MNAAAVHYTTLNWSFMTKVDAGIFGEIEVEVFYDHEYGHPRNPSDTEKCTVTDVVWGTRDVTSLISKESLTALGNKALEHWRM